MTNRQQTEKVGSVGASWPPRFDGRNRRVKGFCTRLVGSANGLKHMFTQVRAVEAKSLDSTRTTVRAFVRQGLTEGPRDFDVEARFDVSNALPGYDLVYFGRNEDERMSEEGVLQRELASVGELLTLAMADEDAARRRIASRGYSTSRLNGNGQEEVGRLVDLYGEAYQEYTFELTPQTVADMLNNGNIFIVGRDGNGQIVSALVAEHVELQLDEGPTVHLYELSDYATFREHRGNGLITLMQMEVVDTIRHLPHGPESIIYAEDRAEWMAVNRSSQRAGLTYCGTLNQACVLVSDRQFGEQGRYENLNVWVANGG